MFFGVFLERDAFENLKLAHGRRRLPVKGQAARIFTFFNKINNGLDWKITPCTSMLQGVMAVTDVRGCQQ
jgi:hypothetical protein